MRPRSVVGPLLLIGLGLLLLARNVWPEIPMFEMFARHWPLLLILWGAVRLGEVLFWYTTRRPLPVHSIGGGEWTAIVFLCLIGSMAFWGSQRTWPAWRISNRTLDVFGESFEFPVNVTKPAGKAPRILLELGRGDVKVVGADVDKVQVTGHQSIRAFQQADADQGAKDAPITVETVGDRIHIKTNHDRLDERRKASASLEIQVPRGASFEGRGKYGDFDISELNGAVEITSDNAGVRVRDINGPVRLELRRSDIIRATNVKGPVEIKGKGQEVELGEIDGPVTVAGGYTGELTFRAITKTLRFEGTQTTFRTEKTPGTIRIRPGALALESVEGPVRITGKTRDMQVMDFSGELDLEVENGDLELRPRGNTGKIRARTKTGNIDLVLASGARFDLRARTGRGEVTNDFGSQLKEDSEGRGALLSGSNGGPEINIETERGHITVRKGSPLAEPSGSVLPRTLTPPAPNAPVPPVVRQ